MTKTPVIKQTLTNSANLESPDSVVNQPQKRIIKSTIKKTSIFSISQFWHLIVITSVVFCFGGFGFGLALRWGQSWQSLNFFVPDNSATSSHNHQSKGQSEMGKGQR